MGSVQKEKYLFWLWTLWTWLEPSARTDSPDLSFRQQLPGLWKPNSVSRSYYAAMLLINLTFRFTCVVWLTENELKKALHPAGWLSVWVTMHEPVKNSNHFLIITIQTGAQVSRYVCLSQSSIMMKSIQIKKILQRLVSTLPLGRIARL